MNNCSNWLSLKSFTVLLVISLLLSLILLPAQAADEDRLSGDTPLKSSSHNPKIETRLELISSTASQAGSKAARKAARDSGIELKRSNLIDVIVEEKAGRIISQNDLKNFGGKILGRTGKLKKVRLPVNRISDMAEKLEGLRYIRSPHTSTTLDYKSDVSNSSFATKGANLIGGSLYHSNNYLGEGTKIAVIDLGFAALDLARDAGEIPEDVIEETKDYTGEGVYSGTAHGTGVAEIVNGMAPKANLYLKKISDEVDLGEATDDAISQGIDVIVHSVGWLNTNFGDGTGVIAEITEKSTEAGILWVNAAGNSARRHWEGSVGDRDENGWVEFESDKEKITIKNEMARDINIYLTWNDWPTTGTDLDLFLYDEDGTLVDSSNNHQTGNEPPAEQINYSSSSPGEYYLKVSGPEDFSSVEIEIYSLNQTLEPRVERSSIMAPGNAEGVFTVGAINKNNWVNGPIEPYSSRGPTYDGRTKPDLTGIDGVTLYTYRSFLGTSAAAPYVAGAGALILSRSPELDLPKLKKALKQNSKDLGKPGSDDVYGAGRMRLIFNSPSISRTVEKDDEEPASPGEVFTVNSSAEMPLTLQGGLTVEESVPDPLEIKEVVRPDSPKKVEKRTVKFDWPIVESGTTKKMTYRVLAPEDTDPGEYEITGTINGNNTESTKITVSPDNSELNRDDLVLKEARAVLDNFSSSTKFRAIGENVHQIRVKVYSLLGKMVFDSDWREGNTFQWNLADDTGKSVPNGVYLYSVTVKGPDGETERSELNKTLVLR